MQDQSTPNVCSGSTTFTWRKVKDLPGLAVRGGLPAARRSALSLALRNRRKPLQVRIWYVGGPTSSWVIQYRGVTWRFEGGTYLEDVGSFLNGENL